MSTIQYLIDGVFAQTTPWQFTTSRSVSVSALVFGAGGGSLYLSNGGPDQELDYGTAGASVGPLPGGLSFSQKDFFSTGIGHVRSRTKDALAFDDMKGVICTIGLAGTGMSGIPYGMSVAMYFMGMPWYFAALDFATMNFAGLIAHGLTSANAMGMMVGRINGLDAGLSVEVGYAGSA